MKKIIAFLLVLVSVISSVTVFADNAEYAKQQNYKQYIGCGVYLFYSEGRVGAINEAEEVIVEPIYYTAACKGTYACGNVFILSDVGETFAADKNYYVFDIYGNLRKKLHYGRTEMKMDGHPQNETGGITATYALGSNLVFQDLAYKDLAMTETPALDCYIKRLISERVAAEDYYYIRALPHGKFIALDKADRHACILNLDGSLQFKTSGNSVTVLDEEGIYLSYVSYADYDDNVRFKEDVMCIYNSKGDLLTEPMIFDNHDKAFAVRSAFRVDKKSRTITNDEMDNFYINY